MDVADKCSSMMVDKVDHYSNTSISEGLEPIRQMMDELQNDDAEIRVCSIKKLPIIAGALGTLRSKNELLPFLKEFIETEEEDEVLLALAGQISNIRDWVEESYAKSEEYLQYIIEIGEIILSSEEVVVREEGCRSFDSLIKGSPEAFAEPLLLLAQKLNSSDSFIKKASSFSIASSLLIHYCSSDLGNLSSVAQRSFALLYEHENVSDDSCLPIIKRSVFGEVDRILSFMVENSKPNNSSLSSLLLKGENDQNFFSLIYRAVDGYHEYIKILSIAPLASLMTLAKEEVEKNLAGIICGTFLDLLTNRSWKVIAVFCPHLPSFLRSYPVYAKISGDQAYIKEIDVIEIFLLAFSESDSTIINAATNVLAPVIQSIMESIDFYVNSSNPNFSLPEEYILPPIESTENLLPIPVQRIYEYIRVMANSPLEEMRSSILGNLPVLAQTLGHECSSVLILPLISSLVDDPKPMVRLTLIGKLDLFIDYLGSKAELMSFFYPAITSLSSDSDWRVRKSVIEFFPLLARTVGDAFFSFEHDGGSLISLLSSALSDDIWAVREAGIGSSCELLKIASHISKKEWIVTFFEGCNAISSSPNYLKRQIVPMLLGKSVGKIINGSVGGDLNICDYLVDYYNPLLSRMTEDKNPNVRLNVAKAIGLLIEFTASLKESSTVIIEFRTNMLRDLERIINDPDCDVKMEAEAAMQLVY